MPAQPSTSGKVIYLLLLLIIGFGTPIFLVLFSIDDPLESTDDLLLAPPEPVAEESNGHPILVRAHEKLEFPEGIGAEDVLHGLDQDESTESILTIEEAQRILRANLQIPDLVEAALQAKEFQPPICRSLEDSTDHVETWKDISRVIASHGFAASIEDDFAKALEFARLNLRLSARLAINSTTLIETMHAFLVRLRAELLVCELARKANRVEDLDKLRDALDCGPDPKEAMVATLRREAWLSDRMLLQLVESEKIREIPGLRFAPSLITRLIFKPNQSRNMFAANYRALIAKVNHEAFLARERGKPRSARPVPIDRVLSGNFAGEVLWNLLAPAEEKAVERYYAYLARLACTRLLIAARSFEVTSGRALRDLQELVPQYIAEVPLDPMCGEPFKFDAARRIIYSVGPNQIDEGGDSEDGDDMVERLDLGSRQ